MLRDLGGRQVGRQEFEHPQLRLRDRLDRGAGAQSRLERLGPSEEPGRRSPAPEAGLGRVELQPRREDLAAVDEGLRQAQAHARRDPGAEAGVEGLQHVHEVGDRVVVPLARHEPVAREPRRRVRQVVSGLVGSGPSHGLLGVRARPPPTRRGRRRAATGRRVRRGRPLRAAPRRRGSPPGTAPRRPRRRR